MDIDPSDFEADFIANRWSNIRNDATVDAANNQRLLTRELAELSNRKAKNFVSRNAPLTHEELDQLIELSRRLQRRVQLLMNFSLRLLSTRQSAEFVIEFTMNFWNNITLEQQDFAKEREFEGQVNRMMQSGTQQ